MIICHVLSKYRLYSINKKQSVNEHFYKQSEKKTFKEKKMKIVNIYLRFDNVIPEIKQSVLSHVKKYDIILLLFWFAEKRLIYFLLP